MTRSIRIFSSPRPTTVETTQRTFQNRYLLKPDPVLNERIVGILGRALELYPVKLHAFVVASTHFHALATYDDPKQMADFHCFLNANLSKEVGHVHDWTKTLFPDRYHHVELSQEPAVEVKRLRYILAHGPKENLCLSPLDWPGVSSTEALISGEPMKGIWIDRTSLRAALKRGETVHEQDFAQEKEVHLTPLPSLAHLSSETRRRIVLDLIRDIEIETINRHKAHGTVPLGITAVLAMRPDYRPGKVARSPRPWFHVLDPTLRKAMTTALMLIVVAYREAADRLKEGKRNVEFPLHSFPPGLPFVRSEAILEPG